MQVQLRLVKKRSRFIWKPGPPVEIGMKKNCDRWTCFRWMCFDRLLKLAHDLCSSLQINFLWQTILTKRKKTANRLASRNTNKSTRKEKPATRQVAANPAAVNHQDVRPIQMEEENSRVLKR